MNRFVSSFTDQRGLGHLMMVAAVAVVVAAGGLAVYQYDAHKVPTSSAANVPHLVCTGTPNCFNDNGGVLAVNNKVTASFREQYDDHEYFQKKVQTGMCNGGLVSDNCPFELGSGLNTRYKGNQVVRFQYKTSAYCLGTSDTTGAAYLKVCADPSAVFVYNTGANGTASGFIESVRLSNAQSSSSHPNHPSWLCNQTGNLLGAYFNPNGASAPFGEQCHWAAF